MRNNTLMTPWHHELGRTAKSGQQHYRSMLGDPRNQHWWRNCVTNITCGQTRESRVSPWGKSRTMIHLPDSVKGPEHQYQQWIKIHDKVSLSRYCAALLSWVSFNASPTVHINHGTVQQHKLVLSGWQWFIRTQGGCARLPHRHNSFNSLNSASFSLPSTVIRAFNFSCLFV